MQAAEGRRGRIFGVGCWGCRRRHARPAASCCRAACLPPRLREMGCQAVFGKPVLGTPLKLPSSLPAAARRAALRPCQLWEFNKWFRKICWELRRGCTPLLCAVSRHAATRASCVMM